MQLKYLFLATVGSTVRVQLKYLFLATVGNKVCVQLKYPLLKVYYYFTSVLNYNFICSSE